MAIKLTEPQANLLESIAPNKSFQEIAANLKTKQALVARDLAVLDASGTKIKPTAKGRKVAQSL